MENGDINRTGPDAGYEKRRFGEISVEKVRLLKEAGSRAIEDFSVCFVHGKELAGSGTLIDAFGELGILTAFHVAEPLMRNLELPVFLIIARHVHRFELPRDCMEHIPLGRPNGARPEDGPDLSFIKITGPEQLATIKSKKSFYRFDARSFRELRHMPLEMLFWWLSGVPASLAKPMTSTSPEGALIATNLVAEAGFIEMTEKKEWDTLSLEIDSGTRPFAQNYEGCSGGGVWVATLTKPERGAADDTLEIDPCRLAGVAYYQSECIGGRRVILANGPNSLQKLHTLQNAD